MADYGEAKVFRIAEMEAITEIPKHHRCAGYSLIPRDTGVSFSFSLTEMYPGGEAETDTHEGREHCFFVLSGIGEAHVNGKKFMVHPYECLWIPPGAVHDFKAVGGQTLRFLVVTSPAFWKEIGSSGKGVKG
jgi:mannose-6-phosphate isomerase-like protein (cupin superfamily)